MEPTAAISQSAIDAALANVQFASAPPASEAEDIDCRSGTVRVRIDPRLDGLNVDPSDSNQLPNGGLLVLARIINVGAATCGLFGLPVGDTTYWWLRRTNDGIVNIYAKADPAEIGNPPARSDEFEQHPYDSVSNPRPSAAQARWNDSVATASADRLFHFAALPASQTNVLAFSWLSCDQGCCTSGRIQ